MMKAILALLLVTSTVAFTFPPQAPTSSTALFVKYGNLGQMALAQDWGPAILQGGSDVGWSVNPDDECDAEDPNCGAYISFEKDVLGAKGGSSLINSAMIGPYKVQGGAHNDWTSSSNVYSMFTINEIQNDAIEEFLTDEE